MKKQKKSKLILYIILVVTSALAGFNRYEFNVYYVDDSQSSKNDIINDSMISSGDWNSQTHISITKSVGSIPYSVFIGDANNDGYNDIATANVGSDDVSILLWNSSLDDWNPQITKPVGDSPYCVFIGDANNDGYNDIATANYGSNNISILLWNSSLGDWDPQITKPAGQDVYSIFIGDANNDGYNDIAMPNSYTSDISILLWNSTMGDWVPQIVGPVGLAPLTVFIGDANTDGYNDIAAANAGSNDVSILLWNSTSGDWNPQITRSVGEEAYSLFMGDANNDGYNDIATANAISGDVSILLWNSTSGDWNPQITKSVGDYPYCVFIGDANNDGYNDIATANYMSLDITILLWNSTLEDWGPQINEPVGNYVSSIFIGDVNNDGHNDITSAVIGSDEVSIILYLPVPWFVDKVKQILTKDYFNFTFYMYDMNKNPIDFATFQIWWNGTDVSNDLYNLGTGYYHISLEPKTVLPQEDPIKLNMTIKAIGYDDIYFEILLTVYPFEISNKLNVIIINNTFSMDYFNLTFYLYDDFDQNVDFAKFKIYWDGANVSTSVQNLGNGYYFISLNPITVAPGEAPILLNMIVSALGYEDRYFETYIAVDPDSLLKGEGGPTGELPLTLIIIISALSAGTIIVLISIYWLRKRKREPQGI